MLPLGRRRAAATGSGETLVIGHQNQEARIEAAELSC